MFHYKKSVPLSYERQGYIYFKSRCYQQLTGKEKHKIFKLCQQAGGEFWQALLEFVTTDQGAARICNRHNISQSTLEQAVGRYYEAFKD